MHLYDLNIGAAFLAAVVWTVAAIGVGRLALRGTPHAVTVRAGLGLATLLAGLLAVLLRVWAAGALAAHGWSVAADFVLVAVPPLVLPAVAAAVFAAPRYWRLATANPGAEPRPGPALRVAAADSLLVVPVQATAVGAGISLVVTMDPTAEPYLPDLLIVLVALALPVVALSLYRRTQARAVADPAWVRPAPGRRVLVGVLRSVVAVVVLGVLAVQAMWASELPAGAATAGHGEHGGAQVSVDQLVTADGEPDQRITLTARQQSVRLASGETVDALAFNGQIPGPTLRLRAGHLVEVTLVNDNIREGVTVHWHGLRVANAADGVAGVTQDAVAVGESYTYRLRTDQVGTFWYHSHQHSATQVHRGLLGALIVDPPDGPAADVEDQTVVAHAWEVDGRARTAFGDNTGVTIRQVPARRTVRLRLVNADNCPRTWALTGSEYRVTAIDGVALSGPMPLTGAQLRIAGGGRYDLEYVQPAATVQLSLTADDNGLPNPYGLNENCGGSQQRGGGGPPQGDQRVQDALAPQSRLALLLGPAPAGEPVEVGAGKVLDPLGYGTKVALPFDADSHFDRDFELRLGQSYGFYDRHFTSRWTVNNLSFPDIEPLVVREGDLVRVRFVNRSQQDHPMHPHGHHMLVLSRDGVAGSGGPWWTDTLNVAPGESYVVGFRADNPGLWMDHCHNLEHARAGMMLHLVYEGVAGPYRIGGDGPNQPE